MRVGSAARRRGTGLGESAGRRRARGAGECRTAGSPAGPEERFDALFRHRRHRVHRQAARAQAARAARIGRALPGSPGLGGARARAARLLGRQPAASDPGGGRPHRPAPGCLGRGAQGPEGADRPLLPPGSRLRPAGRRGAPGSRQRGGHASHGGLRARRRGQALPPRQQHRCRRPLRGGVQRGHVRRGRGAGPPLLHDQARVREDRAARVQGAVVGLPPGDGGGRLEDGRDGQDRRPVLLLQAHPAHAPPAALVDADHRHRGWAHQHRAGGLRGQRARPHLPCPRSRRTLLPSGRPRTDARR